MHGKLSPITTTARGVFTGLPSPLTVDALPFAGDRARVAAGVPRDHGDRPRTARSWACATASSPVEGVQFHPEAILTEHGHALLRNFLEPALTRTAPPTDTRTDPEDSMTITAQEALQRTIEHREIFHDEMLSLMRQIMSGEVSPVLIAAITIGLRVKKETIGEIAAAAQVMREFATKVEVPDREHLVDIVGTGGDASHTFNISTAATFVAAAAGARVAKHGGRSVSSKSGSADVLEALGANIKLTPEQVGAVDRRDGIGFMFAPSHHSAMKHAAPVRKELGVRTIFNILGPLTNPAGAPNQLLGVFHPDLVGIQVRVLQRLGSRHVLVVYGKDGMDEISLGAATMVGELKDGEVREYEIHPEDFGLRMISNRGLKVAGVQESKEMVLEALGNVEGTPREIVVLNAGAALYAADVAGSIAEGIERAREAIASRRGAAQARRVRRRHAEARRSGRCSRPRMDRHPRSGSSRPRREEVAAAKRARPLRGRRRRRARRAAAARFRRRAAREDRRRARRR